MIDLKETKLIASLTLFILTLICGYLPVRIMLNQTLIQYAMFGGGGVLMATAFCHLIPETQDHYKDYLNSIPRNLTNATSAIEDQERQSSSNSSDTSSEHLDGLDESGLRVPVLGICLCSGFFFMSIAELLMVRFINTHTHEHPCDSSTGQLVSGSSFGPTISAGSSSKTGSNFYKFIRGTLIVSAFGAHSIFDGVAIGSQGSIHKLWTTFFAISCHKLIIAAVVGLELYAATLESHLWTLFHLTIFSVMSPIGIILVVVMQDELHLGPDHPAMILLQSFATGTLLYIIFIEILQPKEENNYERNKIGKCVSLIVGFSLMLLVLTFIGD